MQYWRSLQKAQCNYRTAWKTLQIEKLGWVYIVRVRHFFVPADNTEFYWCSLFAQRWIHASTGILSEGLSEQALSCASQDHILPKNTDCKSEITELLVFLSFLNVRLGFHRVATNMSVPVLETWSLVAEVEGGAVFECYTGFFGCIRMQVLLIFPMWLRKQSCKRIYDVLRSFCCSWLAWRDVPKSGSV